MDSIAQNILTAAQALQAAGPRIEAARFTIGFDGFVDEIIHAVATRRSPDEFERIGTLTEFSARIASAAGKSANIELVPQIIKMGGNGPLMALGVAGMGGQITSIGLMGYPDLQPVFAPLRDLGKVISVGNPGHTDALEFRDGKLMLGKLNTIKEMSWKRLCEVMGESELRDLFLSSDVVACNNWTMLTEMKDILDQIIRIIPEGSQVRFFFDLADPEKRSSEDLAVLLEQIQALNGKARCVLGLNLREAEQISRVLKLAEMPDESATGVAQASERIRAKLGIHAVVVHAVGFAGTSIDGETAGIEGPYCANPRLSTGAGDHFNGGFASALAGGLGPRDVLYAGVGTSGWYVRNARSPQRADVVQMLKDWSAGNLPE
jgi:hypothetical protein